jgi:septal ring factor EnvC (AmiA/AmiB activator)
MEMDGMMFYLIIGMAAVLLLVIIYMYLKDSEATRKFRIYEKAIEELNGNIIAQQNTINNLSKKIVAKSEIIRLLDEEKEDTKEALNAVVDRIKEVDDEVKSVGLKAKENADAVEEQSRVMAKPTVHIKPTYNTNDKDIDQKVVQMHKDGYSNDTIAKQLGITIGEIEFMIKRDSMLNALNIKDS